MPTYIALLRGINVGGRNMLAMSDLKNLLTTLHFTNPRSLLQSGNLVFDSGTEQKITALEALLETEIATRFKGPADVSLRTVPELHTIVANNPFPQEALTDAGHLVVMFFKKALAPDSIQDLQRIIKGRERISPNGRELYITYPDGIGTSKLTNTYIEKYTALRGTARNWNTLQKIAALVAPQ
jgi:uncharacterized protein (DUF1697 family)